jgi:adenosine deaminase
LAVVSVETGPIRRVSGPRDPLAGSNAVLSPEVVRRAPKALLHDHLDGGLRPATIIDLAEGAGWYDRLPATDPVALGEWFVEAADSG